MVESFEEFLNKCIPIRKMGIIGTGNISVKDLGDWAWDFLNKTVLEIYVKGFSDKRFILVNGKRKYFDNLFDYFNEKVFDSTNFRRTVWEIAVNCLGKEEVERRLKEIIK